MRDRFSAIDLSGTRFLTLYGRNTSDVFCNPSLQILSVEQALNEWLKSQGIDRTLYYSRSQKIYFWDNESRDRFLPGNIPEPTKPKTKLGIAAPLGDVNLLTSKPKAQTVPAQQSIVPSISRLKDTQCIPYFEAAMHDARWRSALVFSVAEELRQSDLIRELQERLVRWSRLPPNNRNLCVLIFHHETLAGLKEFCSQSDTSYLSGLLTEDNDRHSVVSIPNPSSSEINSLIQHFRIEHEKPIDWIDAQSLPCKLAEQDKSLTYWDKAFRLTPCVSTEQATTLGWLGCDRSSSVESVEDLLAELDSYIGLDSVKKAIRDIAYIEMGNLQLTNKRLNNKTRHMLFLGNPGTGKTTIARLIGRIFKAIGLLKKGHFVETNRKDLVSGYVGQTALKTTEVIESALDGVLFVDEAYALTGGDRDFGQEAINTLVPALENYRDRLIVIFAGYSKEMQEFIDANSGIDSRIPRRYKIIFPDYSPRELVEIFLSLCRSAEWICPSDVKAMLLNYFERCDRGKNFGNGRDVRNLFEEMEDNLKIRIGRDGLTGDQQITFTVEDIPNV